MEPVIIHIDERLAEAGDTLPIAGHIDQASYSLGDHDFQLPSGIDYDLVITNVGEGILATGILRCEVVGSCDRCLEEARFEVSGEVDGYYLFEEPEDAGDDSEEDVDYFLVSEDDTCDLTEALMTALVFETPFVVLCRPDCRGLCPVCGANLNDGDCGHGAQVASEPAPDNPFSVLKDLDLGDSE